jgi:hypothetical protein
MSAIKAQESPTILVELAPRTGLQQATRLPRYLDELSAEALENAMRTVRAMAQWVETTIDDLAGNPDQVEVEFGVKMDFEGQALIAKAGAEAAISVSLTWQRNGAAD